MSPKITGLTAQKRNPKRVNVFLDGEFAFGLSLFTAAWLTIGQELDDDKIKSLKAKDALEVAYQRALNYLSYRPRSEREVRDNLKKKDFSPEVIDQTVDRLKKNSLVNDLEFAKLWAEDRAAFRPRGMYAIRMELRQKGVGREVIDQAFSELTIDEDEMALKIARKQARKYTGETQFDFRRKMGAYLGRRGFSYDTIYSIIEILMKENQIENSKIDNSYQG